MMKFPCYLSRFNVSQVLSQSLIVGTLSAAAVLSGFTPSWSGRSAFVFSNSAYAQSSITSEEVTNYAKSVLAIEPIRLSAYSEIKEKVGSGNIPAIACYKPESLKSLSNKNLRAIAVNYCKKSKEIVESNGLTSSRFNAITVSIQNDSKLADQVQKELKRLQSAGSQ
jgi:hypothetical protein